MSLVDPVDGIYQCPRRLPGGGFCGQNFATFEDRAGHIAAWHDEGGSYKYREHELKARTMRGVSQPLSKEEAQKRIPLEVLV